MAQTIRVSLSINNTIKMIDDAIINASITGERVDYYTVSAPQNTQCVVIVYEKHYYRAGNRLALTVTIDNFEGTTRVHYIGSGGGEGLFKFDWGAAESFANVVAKALRSYII